LITVLHILAAKVAKNLNTTNVIMIFLWFGFFLVDQNNGFGVNIIINYNQLKSNIIVNNVKINRNN